MVPDVRATVAGSLSTSTVSPARNWAAFAASPVSTALVLFAIAATLASGGKRFAVVTVCAGPAVTRIGGRVLPLPRARSPIVRRRALRLSFETSQAVLPFLKAVSRQTLPPMADQA